MIGILIVFSLMALSVWAYYIEKRDICSTPGGVNRDDSIEATLDKRGSSPIWRYVFLCAITSIVTVMSLLYIFQGHGYELNYWSHPIRANIVESILTFSQLFLFGFSPFLFRRLGSLAIVGWIVALLSFFVSLLPPIAIFR